MTEPAEARAAKKHRTGNTSSSSSSSAHQDANNHEQKGVASGLTTRDSLGSGAAKHPPKIVPEVAALRDELVHNRRYFHQLPELSMQEHKTATYVANQLRSYGLQVTEGVGGTGVVGVLRGDGPGPCVGLRADMDALPIPETTDLPFKSNNANVMHACGHDGHMAMLLAAAKVLSAEKSKLRGAVKFIFQPAEEGKAGAKAMIKDGVLETEPRVDEIYGLHVWNYVETGLVGVKAGPLMASSALFYLHVQGHGGHGAVPQGTHDAIVAACHMVTAMQTIVARNISPLDSAVLTVGTIQGGSGYNVIADQVTCSGTVRAFSSETQELVKRRMEEICDGVSKMFGVHAWLDFQYGYPITNSRSQEHVQKVVSAASAVVGKESVFEPESTMAAEDVSFFLNERPGCFFFLGSAPSDHTELIPHHKSNFTFNEDCLPIGSSVFVQLVRLILQQ